MLTYNNRIAVMHLWNSHLLLPEVWLKQELSRFPLDRRLTLMFNGAAHLIAENCSNYLVEKSRKKFEMLLINTIKTIKQIRPKVFITNNQHHMYCNDTFQNILIVYMPEIYPNFVTDSLWTSICKHKEAFWYREAAKIILRQHFPEPDVVYWDSQLLLAFDYFVSCSLYKGWFLSECRCFDRWHPSDIVLRHMAHQLLTQVCSGNDTSVY